MPTINDLDKILKEMGVQRAGWETLFENINSPDWFDLLEQRNLLDLKEDIYWPQGQYLIKVAGSIPEKVLSVITRTETKNYHTQSNFAKALIAMPPEISAKGVAVFRKWLTGDRTGLLWRSGAELLVRLSENNQIEAAFELADALLDVGVKEKEAASKRSEVFLFVGGDWELSEIFKTYFLSFLKIKGVEAVYLLCDKLEKAIDLENDSEKFRDYSDVWRRSIEDSGQNFNHGFKNTFLRAIRDFFSVLLKDDVRLLRQICEHLNNYKSPIFKRIALHLVREFSPDEILPVKFLVNSDLFNSSEVWHEYTLLLRDWFVKLKAETQGQLLEMIGNVHSQYPNYETDEDEKRYARHRRYRFLYIIRNSLDSEHRKVFEAEFKHFGDLDHPTFLSYMSSGWVGPTSPKSLQELEELSIQELSEYLQSWKPSENTKIGFRGPSIDGLARTLEEFVSKNIALFSENINQFHKLNRVYVRSILEGLSKQEGSSGNEIKSLKVSNWQSILKFCESCVLQSNSILIDSEQVENSKESLSLTRLTVLRFVCKSIENDSVPLDLRDLVWRLIELCSDDQDPTPEREEKYSNGRNHFTTALNSTRSYCVETAIHYGRWIFRNKKLEVGEGSFEIYPELQVFLEYFMAVKNEPSLSVRSMFGCFLAQLWLLDSEWFKLNLESIIPLDNNEHFNSAFRTYVAYSYPYDSMFEYTKNLYIEEMKQINSFSNEKLLEEVAVDRLVEHLMIYYSRGLINYEDKLMQLLIKSRWVVLRERALSFIGRTIKSGSMEKEDYDEKFDEKIRARLLEFLDRRIEELKDSSEEGKKELEQIGWWIQSDFFPKDKMFEIVKKVTKLKVTFEPNYAVFEFLYKQVEQRPLEVASCLREQVKLELNKQWFHDYQNHIYNTLSVLINSNDERASALALQIINILAGAGMRSYENLVSE